MGFSMLERIQKAISDSISVKSDILESEELIRGIQSIANVCIEALKGGKKIFLAGNGGSAADAQHIAAELVSRFYYDRPGLPAIALTTDTSVLTAIGNDYGYERLFARQIEALASIGDVFIGITTSGNSKNIIEALRMCSDLGVVSVALSGQGGNALAESQFPLSIPSNSTPRIQESQLMIGHIICELIEAEIFPRR